MLACSRQVVCIAGCTVWPAMRVWRLLASMQQEAVVITKLYILEQIRRWMPGTNDSMPNMRASGWLVSAH